MPPSGTACTGVATADTCSKHKAALVSFPLPWKDPTCAETSYQTPNVTRTRPLLRSQAVILCAAVPANSSYCSQYTNPQSHPTKNHALPSQLPPCCTPRVSESLTLPASDFCSQYISLANQTDEQRRFVRSAKMQDSLQARRRGHVERICQHSTAYSQNGQRSQACRWRWGCHARKRHLHEETTRLHGDQHCTLSALFSADAALS